MEHATRPSVIAPTADDAKRASTNYTAALHSLMLYKAWADAELMKTLLGLPAAMPSPEDGYVTAIIRHFHTVDCIFRAHLLGIPHGFDSPNPTEPATLSELQPRTAATDAWFVEYTRTLDERDLGEALHVTFTDGQEQVMTRSDILLHISLHGAGHRGQVSVLLRKCGATPPPDRFTSYLNHRSEPLER